jgi:hypothetical protein
MDNPFPSVDTTAILTPTVIDQQPVSPGSPFTSGLVALDHQLGPSLVDNNRHHACWRTRVQYCPPDGVPAGALREGAPNPPMSPGDGVLQDPLYKKVKAQSETMARQVAAIRGLLGQASQPPST